VVEIPDRDLIRIRVYGKPEPFAKLLRGKYSNIFARDPGGRKKAWMKLVAMTGLVYMRGYGLEPFPQHHSVAMGCLIFLPKARSCKLPYPSQRPDLDNLKYAIWNALKGVAYYDDDQVIYTAQPDGEVWATPDEPPGVLITMFDYERYPILQLAGGLEMGTQQCLTL
jgi:hypothetical protein